ncbi:hypothetical protein JZO77_22765 [Enterococcus hulanensis]|uniref:SpaA isopeptide-forming pilin-related protein n=1 Tax=Enterococcus hulanensis TaxID=2559929 RepID=UPI001A8D7476|nr:SpaA isopeptide-forming pilin-related protein [Enterococcus hulanensis]MBO0459564.1 hypothetical protein [Enterococcus hulanensis]
MREKIKQKPIVAVLLPIFFLLVVGFSVYQWNPLKADDSMQQFAQVKLAGARETNDEAVIAADSSIVELTGTESLIVRIPDSEEYSLQWLDSSENPLTIEDKSQKELESLIEQTKKMDTDKKKEKPNVFRVASDQNDNATYLQLVKDQSITMLVRHLTNKQASIILYDLEDTNKNQTILTFSAAQLDKVNAELENSSENGTSDSESKNNYKNILDVKTEITKDSLKELLETPYQKEDSLKTPVFLKESTSNKKANNVGTMNNSSVIIKDVKTTIKTGTAKFDNDIDPGHDNSETNDIVRTYDQVAYLVSFSIQNTTADKKYTDFRYRVITELSNAVEIIGTGPINNGEISNGTYIDTPAADGSQISQGVMESTISDTGQIFIPIILNVYGTTHGKIFQPTIKLELVSAKNEETGETEAFNQTYDDKNFSALKIPETKATAKPSVRVRLVRGERSSGEIFGLSNANVDSIDVGAVTELRPLDGRDAGDFRGACFPSGPIKYQIKQKGTKTLMSGEKQSLDTAERDSMTLVASSIATKDRSLAAWQKESSWTMDESKLKDTLDIPSGVTNKIYTSQPPGDVSSIGVYNSGSVSHTNTSYTSTITNSGYHGVENPYTYTMKGNRTPTATSKAFTSEEFVFHWDRTNSQNAGVAGNWQRYMETLYVDEVTYDGEKTPNDSSLDYETVIGVPGGFSTSVIVQDLNHKNVSLTKGGDPQHNTGNARVKQNQKIWFRMPSSTGMFNDRDDMRIGQSILMWDPSGFEYDTSRETWYAKKRAPENLFPNLGDNEEDYYANESTEFRYGVAKDLAKTPSYTMKVEDIAPTDALYYWYSTPALAQAAGEIAAVQVITTGNASAKVPRFYHDIVVPVTVKAKPGSTTPKGNPLTVLGSMRFRGVNGRVLNSVSDGGPRALTPVNEVATFKPTVFNSSGVATSIPLLYWNHIGESMYVEPFSINTETHVKEKTYNTNEEIDIRVNGIFSGDKDINYSSALNTTLPKGIVYKTGSSEDAEGKKLNDPTIVNNPDGTTTLRWPFNNIPDIGKGLEVNFKATTDFKQLIFKDNGVTNSLDVKTVGEVWETGKPDNKDNADESYRSSMDSFIEIMNQKVILTKKEDKPSIEVGKNDPLGEDTSITYTVKMNNQSINIIPNARLLDVLPYTGDSRGSKLSGDYTVKSIEVKADKNAKLDISFTNNTISVGTNPNSITGWTEYIPDATPTDDIKDAKGFLVNCDSLGIGDSLELKIKIQPTGQKAGDAFVNTASMNSDLNLPVDSQAVWTRVYGRDLTGYVWYDDDYDGLIGNKSNGSPEDPVGNIPVKLYRTSQKDSSYKKELVKESLTGEEFIDPDTGDSLIKTGSDGKYKFENLPEGEYIAEFIVGDIVVTRKVAIVTKQLQGTGEYDPLNSKADPAAPFRTPEKNEAGDPFYVHPELKDLPAILTGNDKVQHITDVNAGLTRLSKIRLFKYEEGTVIDADGDGKLSDEEIEASTTNALEGAEFQLYKGKSDDPNTIKDENKVGTVKVTDEHGWLEFESLPPGFYTIVETKAPAGFELLKNPIEVEVPTYNYIAIVHVPDSAQTKLPFTGSTKAMRIILIAAAVLMVVGMTGVFLHFRPINVKGGK